MKIMGVIAEYNPFHNGHKYMLTEARRKTGADVCVVAMSGDFTQRGEPAILDKWQRAELALRNGADLVIEIPSVFAISDAGKYAGAGVELLNAVGCDVIAFGSESGEIDSLTRVAERLDQEKERLIELVQEKSREGLSYPAAREAAYRELYESDSSDAQSFTKEIEILSSSNDILALEYIRSIRNRGFKITPCVIERQGASYHSDIDEGEVFQSASGIRRVLSTSGDITEDISERISAYVPSDSLEMLNRNAFRLEEIEANYFMLARMAILRSDEGQVDEVPSGGEGLFMRLHSAATSAENLEELINFAKSKRYTHTRISRLIAQLLLGIKRADNQDLPAYVRVLGFNELGRTILSVNRKREDRIPIITNVNKQRELLDDRGRRQIEFDELASHVYNLISGKALYSNSDRVLRPINIENIEK